METYEKSRFGEELRLLERYVRFNVPELIHAAASVQWTNDNAFPSSRSQREASTKISSSLWTMEPK